MDGSRTVAPETVLVHRVKRAGAALGPPTAAWRDGAWEAAEEATIDHWAWPEPGCEVTPHPQVEAKTLYDDTCLAIQFRVRDDLAVRAQYTDWQAKVCCDSCCEFFVAPFAESDDKTPYFNFEINCAGTMLVFHCTRTVDRGNVELSRDDAARIRVAATLAPERTTAADGGAAIDLRDAGPQAYGVEYRVPWSLFETYFGVARPAASARWRGNFYKCGDDTGRPHWGAWAPVGTPRPNFHRPSDFQVLQFD